MSMPCPTTSSTLCPTTSSTLCPSSYSTLSLEVGRPNSLSKEQLIKTVASIFQALVSDLPLLPTQPFLSSSCAPSISLEDYLQRIGKFSKCSQECFVMAVVYLERLAQKQVVQVFDKYNVHRLLMIAVISAVKFVDDVFYSNEYYRKVAGLSLEEFNGLEVVFLQLLEYELNIEHSLYYKYNCVLGDYASAHRL